VNTADAVSAIGVLRLILRHDEVVGDMCMCDMWYGDERRYVVVSEELLALLNVFYTVDALPSQVAHK
jgi:hypothetical protein